MDRFLKPLRVMLTLAALAAGAILGQSVCAAGATITAPAPIGGMECLACGMDVQGDQPLLSAETPLAQHAAIRTSSSILPAAAVARNRSPADVLAGRVLSTRLPAPAPGSHGAARPFLARVPNSRQILRL